jgi:NAD(P)-dependent dehydrogenase (short-subunit alcohol dehydrogenase family)
MRHAVLLGASRGIAYYTTLNLLSTDEWTCTLLLRKPETLAADPKLTPYVESGKLVFVKGNGTNVEDVAKLFDKPADVVITSIGE